MTYSGRLREFLKQPEHVIPCTIVGVTAVAAALTVFIPSEESYQVDSAKPGTITSLQEYPEKRDDFYINGTYMGKTIRPNYTFEQCDQIDKDFCASVIITLPHDYVPGTLAVGTIVIPDTID